MMKKFLVSCTTAALLIAGNASAGHCDTELTEAEWAIDNATQVESNALEAAEALVDHALEVCAFEEEQQLAEGFDLPIADPEYVSMGQSMLINAKDLAAGP
jgi:hypothetical protein